MLRRDEVDVVATNFLQVEHDAREFRRCNFSAFTELTGLEILTKYAAKIAPAEKDRARSIPATQAIFFAEMRERAGHAREPAALAHADLVIEPIDLAIARTNLARPERFDRLLGALLKNPLFERSHINRNKILAMQGESPASIELEWQRSVTATEKIVCGEVCNADFGHACCRKGSRKRPTLNASPNADMLAFAMTTGHTEIIGW